jgi:type II secretory pathway pseudopilin PulG
MLSKKIKEENFRGVTLVELLVIISIVALLSALVFPNYKKEAQQLALQRSASKLYQDSRRVAEMSISSSICQKCTIKDVPANGYGIVLEPQNSHTQYIDNTKYIIFAHNDPDTDNYYYNTTTDTIIETVKLETGVIVLNINNGNSPHLSINFRPPEPKLGLMCEVCGPVFPEQAEITLALKDDLSKTKTIYVNVAGLIYEKP